MKQPPIPQILLAGLLVSGAALSAPRPQQGSPVEEPGSLSARFVDAAGRPQPGVTLSICPLDESRIWESGVTSDEGEVLFDSLPPGEYAIAPGYFMDWMASGIATPEPRIVTVLPGELTKVELSLPASSVVLEGNVICAPGSGGGPRYRIRIATRVGDRHTTTDSYGRFRLAGIPPGPTEVTAHQLADGAPSLWSCTHNEPLRRKSLQEPIAGFRDYETQWLEAFHGPGRVPRAARFVARRVIEIPEGVDRHSLLIVEGIDPGARLLVGRITRSGAPIEGATVRLDEDTEPWIRPASTRTDAEGTYCLEVRPGRGQLTVRTSQGEAGTRRIEIPEEGRLREDFDLGGPGIRGALADPESDIASPGIIHLSGSDLSVSVPLAGGRFELPGLPAGHYDLEVRIVGPPRIARVEDIDYDGTDWLDLGTISIHPEANLEVVVRDEAGRRVPNVRCRLLGRDRELQPDLHFFPSIPSERFTIRGVPGPDTLEVTSEGYRTERRKVSLLPGAPPAVPIELVKQ